MKTVLNKKLLYLLVPLLLFLILTSNISNASTIKSFLKKASKDGKYVSPDLMELKKAENLFSLLFQGKITNELKKEWNNLDFTLVEHKEEGEDFILLLENDTAKRGRGFYIFKPSSEMNIALQIPHSFKDLFTREIGLKIFLEGKFIATAFNTIPRHYMDGSRKVNADLTHLSQSYFTAHAKAFDRNFPEGYIVQFHGFSKKKRRSKTGFNSDIIISNGTLLPDNKLKHIDNCFGKLIDGRVSLYPKEVQELGARTNVTGMILFKMGMSRLIHIEMSKPVRIHLRDNKKLRYKIIDCLVKCCLEDD